MQLTALANSSFTQAANDSLVAEVAIEHAAQLFGRIEPVYNSYPCHEFHIGSGRKFGDDVSKNVMTVKADMASLDVKIVGNLRGYRECLWALRLETDPVQGILLMHGPGLENRASYLVSSDGFEALRRDYLAQLSLLFEGDEWPQGKMTRRDRQIYTSCAQGLR